jgi:hypothetical protein
MLERVKTLQVPHRRHQSPANDVMKSATLSVRRDIFCLILVMSIQSTTVTGLRCYECTTDPQAKSKMDGLFSDFIITTPDCQNNLEKIGLSFCPLGVYYCQVAVAQSGKKPLINC